MRTPETISEVASHFKMTHRALRFYEQKGLIHPTRRGTSRLYGPDELRRLHLIQRWTAVGATLAQVRKLLARFEQGDAAAKEAVNREVDAIAARTDAEARDKVIAITDWFERRAALAKAEGRP